MNIIHYMQMLYDTVCIQYYWWKSISSESVILDQLARLRLVLQALVVEWIDHIQLI